MARPLRIEFAGALYHVMSRGNERKAIVRDDLDREKRLDWLRRTVQTHGWRLHAFVLRGNHEHLFVETREANLSRGAVVAVGDVHAGAWRIRLRDNDSPSRLCEIRSIGYRRAAAIAAGWAVDGLLLGSERSVAKMRRLRLPALDDRHRILALRVPECRPHNHHGTRLSAEDQELWNPGESNTVLPGTGLSSSSADPRCRNG